MQQQQITIINKLGLHTRAAAKLVSTAARFVSKIELTNNGHAVNAKSIMGVITLGASKGTTLDLTVTGDDEEAAKQAIIELVNNRFGESE